jgi:hypothetical protein
MEPLYKVAMAESFTQSKNYSTNDILTLKNKIDSNIEKNKAKFTITFSKESEFEVYIKKLVTTVNVDGSCFSYIEICTTDINSTLIIGLQKLEDVR